MAPTPVPMSITLPAPAAAPPRVAPARLAGVAVVVFVANAGLLVLQLAAGRLLVPFIGSSLETWTAVIGVFLAGIALGNAVGGKVADRSPTPRALARFLALGAAAAGWMVAFPELLAATGWYRPLPLGVRTLVLAAAECFPAGFALSLLTPVAVRLGLPDVRAAGRAAGRVFAVGTLGCLAGNYAAGFVLIPAFTVNTIVFGTAGVLALTAVAALGLRSPVPGGGDGAGRGAGPDGVGGRGGLLPLPRACALVFACSFGGMALELTASRVLAQVVGVSLYTWTGVIGVMLAGTACGNWLGGVLADRAGRGSDAAAGRSALAACLVAAAAAAVLVLVGFFTLTRAEAFAGLPIVPRVLAWAFALFFLPMLLLGTVSPQVIRLATPDVASAGRVAGRVYAWSTAGAIAGTFATGYLLISTIGMYRTILGVALLAAAAAPFAARVWERRAVLYVLSLVLGTVFAGFALLTPENTRVTRETNYFTLCVLPDPDRPDVLRLKQDLLVHSWVRPTDPTFIHYRHEQVQLEFLRAAGPNAAALVIGGGGYTFPRAAKTELPGTRIDVVEIDPGVTEVAYSHLGLDPALGIRTVNADGRQFLAEGAVPGSYALVTLDAVNDLSVPYHLLTKECNDEVKRVLAPGGVYLATVIDDVRNGRLWKATAHTLRQTFAHVELLTSTVDWPVEGQAVVVLYAADRPLDLDAVRKATRKPPADLQVAVVSGAGAAAQPRWFTHRPPAADVARLLAADLPLVLTDQYAPVDNLMAGVFRHRKGEKR